MSESLAGNLGNGSAKEKFKRGKVVETGKYNL